MMRNSSAVAAAAGNDGRLLFVKLYQQSPDGSRNQYFRGISPALFLKNSRIINLSSFNRSGMGGACGGLFYLDDCEGKQAVIFNPMTSEFKFLPPCDVERPPKSNHFSCSACGFGFDSLSDDYKVIRFVSNCYEMFGDDGRYEGVVPLEGQVEIYSLGNDRWREIPVPNLLLQTLVCGSGLYVNGKCYWIIGGPPLRVLSFDFEMECFSFIALPTYMKEKMDLHEYKGSLAVIGYEWSGSDRSFEVWILKEKDEEEEWEKLFDVKAPGSTCRTLGFGKNGGVLFLEGYVEIGDKYGTALLEYDLIHGNLKKHPIVHQQASMQIFSYSYLDRTGWLPDAELANPIKEEGIKGIEIFPPSVESTSVEDKDVGIFPRKEEGMEFLVLRAQFEKSFMY